MAILDYRNTGAFFDLANALSGGRLALRIGHAINQFSDALKSFWKWYCFVASNDRGHSRRHIVRPLRVTNRVQRNRANLF